MSAGASASAEEEEETNATGGILELLTGPAVPAKKGDEGDMLEAQVDEAEKKATKIAALPGAVPAVPAAPAVPAKPVEEDADAPEDVEDEGQPQRNEGEVVVAPPAGESSVDFDTKQNKEFSNYFVAKMTIDGKVWPTVEHYFQAMKFPSNPEYQEQIRVAKTPAAAKKLGKTTEVPTRPDWSKVRESVMLTAVRTKFQIPALKAKLLSTGDVLIRDMSPQDNFWGVGRSGKGQNKLGKILMRVREELKASVPAPAIEVSAAEQVPLANMLTEAPPQAAEAAAPELPPELPTEPLGPVAESVAEPVGEPVEILDIPTEEAMEPRQDMVAEDGSKVADWGANETIKVIKY